MNNKRTFRLSLPSLEGGVWGGSVGPSVWLFLELVVITIVAWVVVDPAVVNLYYLHLPKGYDSERLVYAEIRGLIHSEPVVGDTPFGSKLAPWLTERLKETEGVENAYCYNSFNNPSSRYSSQVPVCREHDTIYVACTRFEEGRHFFETFGLRPLPGSPKAEELSEQKEAEKGAVLSESAAKYVFGTSEGIVGRRFTVLNMSNNEPEQHWTVAGVVANAQHQRYSSLHSMIYFPSYSDTTPSFIMIRLRKGVKPQKFVDEHAADIMSTVQTPFFRIKKMEPYEELLHRERGPAERIAAEDEHKPRAGPVLPRQPEPGRHRHGVAAGPPADGGMRRAPCLRSHKAAPAHVLPLAGSLACHRLRPHRMLHLLPVRLQRL